MVEGGGLENRWSPQATRGFGQRPPVWANPSPPRMTLYFLYVLRSRRDGLLCTGVTKDLARRMREHQSGKTRSLRARRPLLLVYLEAYSTRGEALARERFFKTPRGGAMKQRLVRSHLSGA